MDITITVNGKRRTLTTEATRPLLDLLREELGLTGTKYGCGEGQCGACTVLLDGRAVPACLITAEKAAGAAVTTIEGLGTNDTLHPVQAAFLAEGAMQCGYCTPGMVMRAVALIEEKPDLTEQDVRVGMNGHLCRCNGYARILAAIRRAVRSRDQEAGS